MSVWHSNKKPQGCCKIAGIAIVANCIAIHIAWQVSRFIDASMNRDDTTRLYGSNFNFLDGRKSKNTWPIPLKFGTVVSLPDVNWHLKFEQNRWWSGFWVIDLPWNRPRERVKDSKKKRTGGQKCCLSGFLAFASYWAILWKKLHFLPEVNLCSPIRPTNGKVFLHCLGAM